MKESSEFTAGPVARTLAIILAAAFVLTAVAALILFNLERRAFDPATYTKALLKENFYRKFPALLGDLLARNLGDTAPAFARRMTAANWETLVQTLLPAQQLQDMTEEAIDQFFAYLNGQTENPHLSLIPMKENLVSPAGLDAAITIIKAQPACTLEQIARLLLTFGQDLCNPPQEILDLLRPIIQAQLRASAAAIPDEISLVTDRDSSARPASRLQGLKTVRLLMRLSPLIPMALLLAVTLLVVRTLRSWLTWWGWPLLATGVLGMLVAFGGAPLFRGTVEQILSRRMTVSMPAQLAGSIRAIVDTALREMLKPAGWEFLALFIAGAAMLVAAYYLTGRAQKGQIESSEAATQVL
jgi:hypothetical protein